MFAYSDAQRFVLSLCSEFRVVMSAVVPAYKRCLVRFYLQLFVGSLMSLRLRIVNCTNPDTAKMSRLRIVHKIIIQISKEYNNSKIQHKKRGKKEI
jgi:hypothetical protein